MFKIHYVAYNYIGNNYARVSRPRGSGDYLFLYCSSSMHIIRPDGIDAADPGSCILYPVGQEQDYSAIRDYKVSFVHFSADEGDVEHFGLPMGKVFFPLDPESVNHTISEIRTEFFVRNEFSEDAMDALLRRMFTSLGRGCFEQRFEDEKERELFHLFCMARYTMLSNCEREWASTNMSQMVSLSRSQFYKYYNDFFGVSPMQDLQDARIERAKCLLTDDSLKVSEVASMCGYASIHHFSRTFKEHVGMSPLNYVRSILPEEE